MVCILIAGMPATGKTSFARWLSRRRGIPYASKDAIKERLYDSLGFRSRAEKVKLGEAAAQLLCDFGAAHLSLGQSVILENNFEDVSLPGVSALLQQADCRTVTVLFDGDVETVYRRFVARDQSPDRHRGHVSNTCYPESADSGPAQILSLSDFAAGVERRGFRRFDVGAPVIRVDSTDFARVDYEAVNAAIDRALMAAGDGAPRRMDERE